MKNSDCLIISSVEDSSLFGKRRLFNENSDVECEFGTVTLPLFLQFLQDVDIVILSSRSFKLSCQSANIYFSQIVNSQRCAIN